MYYCEFWNGKILYQTRLYWLVIMPFDGIVLEVVFFTVTFCVLFGLFCVVHTALLRRRNGGFCRQRRIDTRRTTKTSEVRRPKAYAAYLLDEKSHPNDSVNGRDSGKPWGIVLF